MKFFTIRLVQMISLGSFRIKNLNDVRENTWWYELTFLFIEISWGRIGSIDKLKKIKNEEVPNNL